MSVHVKLSRFFLTKFQVNRNFNSIRILLPYINLQFKYLMPERPVKMAKTFSLDYFRSRRSQLLFLLWSIGTSNCTTCCDKYLEKLFSHDFIKSRLLIINSIIFQYISVQKTFSQKLYLIFRYLYLQIPEFEEKKSARFAGTFSSRALRAARKFERAQGARFDRRASRSVLCSSHTFKFISYNLILKLKLI